MYTCRLCGKRVVVGGLTVELRNEARTVIDVHTSCFLLYTKAKPNPPIKEKK